MLFSKAISVHSYFHPKNVKRQKTHAGMQHTQRSLDGNSRKASMLSKFLLKNSSECEGICNRSSGVWPTLLASVRVYICALVYACQKKFEVINGAFFALVLCGAHSTRSSCLLWWCHTISAQTHANQDPDHPVPLTSDL